MECFNEIRSGIFKALAAPWRIRYLDAVSDLSIGQHALRGFPAA